MNNIDLASLKHCRNLLKSIEDSSSIKSAAIYPVEAGVWNNYILKIEIAGKTYYFKEYRKLVDIPNYTPPNISARRRAKIAYTAQSMASNTFKNGYRLTPSILSHDDTAFIMEAIPETNHLLSYLSRGECPDTIIKDLPMGLAAFHTSASSKIGEASLWQDSRFRNYKLRLQYYNGIQQLSAHQGEIIKRFTDDYKKLRHCIVHGDLNSKNVLLAPDEKAYVIDFEQAHLGSPAYDLAFILSELYIASIMFRNNVNFQGLCRVFAERYLNSLEGYDAPAIAREATIHLAMQVLYRFNGPSRAVWTSYVDGSSRQEAIEQAKSFITDRPLLITDIL